MSSARFNIIAKLPAGASIEQIPEMVQSLLTERFGMALEHGTKEQAVYAVISGKDGPKLKPAATTADNQASTVLEVDDRLRQVIMIGFPPSGVVIHGPAASLATVAEAISRFTSRRVVAMTGFEGRYQFELNFEPETMGSMADPRVGPDGIRAAPGGPAPSLSETVQQYGLKLEARKTPIELLTITHLEKAPTEN